MGFHYNSKIVKDGLVLHYDMGNDKKSFIGAPTTNVYGGVDASTTERSPHTQYVWNGSDWIGTNPGFSGPLGVNLGKVNKYTSGALSSTWSGNSYGYVLRPMTLTNGQYYVLSAWVYVSPDCNITGMYLVQELTGGGTPPSGYTYLYDLNKKGTWQRLAYACTAATDPIQVIPIYPSREGVTDGSFSGFYAYGAPMLETNTYPSTPTDTSRSTTQSLLDLTNNNTITAYSLTYAADNTFSFNGTTNIITTSFAAQTLFAYTIEAWIYDTKGSGYRAIVQYSDTADRALYIDPSHKLNLYNSGTYSSTSVPANQWVHVVAAYSSISSILYSVNGVTTAGTGAVDLSSIGYLRIGAAYTGDSESFGGKIAVVRFYNRPLSAYEVKQNFDASKGRFGL